jgi:LTXXQ motif family protein
MRSNSETCVPNSANGGCDCRRVSAHCARTGSLASRRSLRGKAGSRHISTIGPCSVSGGPNGLRRIRHGDATIAWHSWRGAGLCSGLISTPNLFYYPFWPEAYDDAYWAYAYDDFVGSIYWAVGNPYAVYAYGAPTAQTIGPVPGRTSKKRKTTRLAPDLCESVSAITAWPFERIGRVVEPTAQQQAILDELKATAAQAANDLKVSCTRAAALTPTGRLQAMLDRLLASLNALHMVRPPLRKFYDSLTDEQKARFNAIGPNVGQKTGTVRTEAQDAPCSAQKSGLTELPIERIEDVVRPTGLQQAGLERLSRANDEAVAVLQAACPDSIQQTPLGDWTPSKSGSKP